MRTTRSERAAPSALAGLRPQRRLWLWLLAVLMVTVLALGVAGCRSGGNRATGGTSTTSGSDTRSTPSGDIDGTVGEAIKVGNAVITVRALEATFTPVAPTQRMSEQTPTAPGGDESFYQAYVMVENTDVMPIRVDPEDFACAVGNSVVGIEPTWSGPLARSLLKNSSLDLLLTFKAKAGYEPVLLYSPAWYQGTIRIRQAPTTTSTSGS